MSLDNISRSKNIFFAKSNRLLTFRESTNAHQKSGEKCSWRCRVRRRIR